jgi:integrase
MSAMAVIKNKDGRTYHIKGKVKLPNGKWKDYQKTKIKYTKKKDAEIAERELRESLVNSSKTLTFGQLVTLFHDRWKLQNIDETSIVTYESYYKNHLEYFFSDVNIADINIRMIEDWKVYMSMKKQKNGNSYAAETINHAKYVLSKYMSFAVELGYIDVNPCSGVKRYQDPNKKIDPFEHNENFWELSEFERFIGFVKDPYWNQVFRFLFETGVREGEMFALTWSNIFFDKNKIRIKQSISTKSLEKNSTYRIKSPKNKRSFREIDMNTDLYNLLKDRYDASCKTDGFNDNYFVFGNIKPLARSTLARHLEKYIKLSGVKRITPHGFRHSHASLLIRAKVDDNLIAERLGHTVEELRRTYAHIYEDERSDMKASLDSIFESRKNPESLQKSS